MLFLFIVLIVLAIANADQGDGSNPMNAGGVKNTLDPMAIDNPYNYSCTRQERVSGRCRWCNRETEVEPAVWVPIPPYWQRSGRCENQAFDVEDTRKCLTGRTMYVIGNSVGRQSAFNIIEMLGGSHVNRENQKELCPKHDVVWSESCHSEIGGLKIKYMYLNFMDGSYFDDRNGFPYYRYLDANGAWTTGRLAFNDDTNNSATNNGVPKYRHHHNDFVFLDAAQDKVVHKNGICEDHDVRTCLAKFFHGAQTRDILVLTIGMDYFNISQHRKFDEEPEQSPGVDFQQWLISSAVAFKAHIAATFPGQVFRSNMAEFNPFSKIAVHSSDLNKINKALEVIWAPTSEELPWYNIDQWRINKSRFFYYNDHVHFSGPLTFAMLTQMLNELCPGGGKYTWRFPVGGNSGGNLPAALAALPPMILTVGTGSNRAEFYVLFNGTRHLIPNMDTLDGLELDSITDPNNKKKVDVAKEDLGVFKEGEPLVACDKVEVPNRCKDSVYYKSFHGLL